MGRAGEKEAKWAGLEIGPSAFLSFSFVFIFCFLLFIRMLFNYNIMRMLFNYNIILYWILFPSFLYFHGFAFKLEVKFQIWIIYIYIYIHHLDIVTKCTHTKIQIQHDACIIECLLLLIFLCHMK
jgi:hypothetical protein